MKRFAAFFLCVLFLSGLSACSKKTEDGTTAATTDAYEYNGPSLEEMSPPAMSTALPVEMPMSYAAVDKSGFKPIKAADSYWPETQATSIYKSGDTQYFIMGGGVVYALINAGDDVFYSAYYDKEGKLLFMGEEAKNWYFDENGSFDYLTYTYTAPSGAQVISFYEGEDTRFAVYAGQTYYDGDLNELTGEQQVQLVTRVAAAFSMMGGMNNL